MINVIDYKYDFKLAHKNDEKEQKLYGHLLNVAKESEEFGEKIGCSNICYVIGLLHDIGKVHEKFQKKLLEDNKIKVIHSVGGSKYLLEYKKKVINELKEENKKEFEDYIDILSYVIQAHHGLYDFKDSFSFESEYGVKNRLELKNEIYNEKNKNYDKNYNYNEIIGFLNFLEKKYAINLEEKLERGFEEYSKKINELVEKTDNNLNQKYLIKMTNFYNSMFIRLFLSILKLNDITDTINAYDDEIIQKNNNLSEVKKIFYKNIENKYDEFKNIKNTESNLNCARQEISNLIKERSKKDDYGIYKLELPTGAGKTLLSLRYGMNQLFYKNKERFIYVTPFLSVLEQNADIMRTILLKDIGQNYEKEILEYHSNILCENDNTDSNKDDEIEDVQIKYLMDTFSSTCVFTTMVQFINSLLKGKSSEIVRFSSFVNAVIVVDEVQSLPLKIIGVTNLIFNFMKIIMKTNIILSTATQPNFTNKSLTYKILYGDIDGNNKCISIDEISSNVDVEKIKEIFKRVDIDLLNGGQILKEEEYKKEIFNEINKKENKDKSILMIFNTKKVVSDVYDYILKNNKELEICEDNIYYLTTFLCPAHRKDIIKDMKEKLEKGIKIICVSTQLIEAGVDIDFDYVIRALAGFDSIVQSAGRCNREGKIEGKGRISLVKLSKKIENLDFLEDIKDKKEISNIILKEQNILLELNNLSKKFYDEYFKANNDDKEFWQFNDKGLSDNDKNLLEKIGNKNLKYASEKFNLIDNKNTVSVLVYYKESKEMIEELIELIQGLDYEDFTENIKNIKKYLKKLQKYTINIFVNNDKINDIIFNVEKRGIKINVLLEKNYDLKKGLLLEDNIFVI